MRKRDSKYWSRIKRRQNRVYGGSEQTGSGATLYVTAEDLAVAFGDQPVPETVHYRVAAWGKGKRTLVIRVRAEPPAAPPVESSPSA